MKRLRVEGFFSPDFYHREKEFNPILKNWVNENKLNSSFQITKSLEKLPEAYLKLFEGGNIGKVVVELKISLKTNSLLKNTISNHLR